MQTPLENFMDCKADTSMQCGNYSIDIPKLQEGEQYRFHFDATTCVGCRCCVVACNEQNNNPADIKWRRVGEMEGGTFPAFTQLLNSMSCNHCIIKQGWEDEGYILANTNGYKELKKHLQNYPPQEVPNITSIDVKILYELALKEYASIVNVSEQIIPTDRGYQYAEIINAIDRGKIKALCIVATNPLVSFVNQEKLRKTLAKLDILVVQDAFLGDTAQIVDIIFPAATWGEKEGTYTNSERRCNRANKAVKPLGNSKNDFDIVVEFSHYFDGVQEMLFPEWTSPKDAFEECKRVSKGQLGDYSGMSYELMEELGGVQWPCNEENPKGTKRLYTPEIAFRTKDKKAKLLCLDWFPMSEPIDILNHLAPESWVDINSADVKVLKVKSGDRMSLSSKRRRIEDIVVRVTQSVAPGNVFVPFHCNTQPVNALTHKNFCPKSGEPNFKQTAIQLHSSEVPDGLELTKEESAGQIEHIKTAAEGIRYQQKLTVNYEK